MKRLMTAVTMLSIAVGSFAMTRSSLSVAPSKAHDATIDAAIDARLHQLLRKAQVAATVAQVN